MSNDNEPNLRLIVWGSAELKEYPTIAGIKDIENEDIFTNLDHGDSIVLDTEPPIKIEVRSS